MGLYHSIQPFVHKSLLLGWYLTTGLGVTSSELYANKQADLYEEQQARLYEEQQAALCDSGLPDTEVCDVLQVPPTEMPVFSEAWSRG